MEKVKLVHELGGRNNTKTFTKPDTQTKMITKRQKNNSGNIQPLIGKFQTSSLSDNTDSAHSRPTGPQEPRSVAAASTVAQTLRSISSAQSHKSHTNPAIFKQQHAKQEWNGEKEEEKIIMLKNVE